jgi:transposase
MTKRTRYSQEFKREAVAMASQPGVTCRQVALEIGVNPNLLSRWKRELEEVPAKAFKGSGTPRDEELARLKRELARVKKERDFLREAATFFAKGSS